VNLFARELQAVIPHDGLSYYNETHELAFNMGRSGQHSCTYRLNADDKSLGEFALSRERRFSQSEIGLLERLLRSLVYPLRNALLYRDAASAAIKDPLTGIFNRAMLETALVREIGLARRHQDPFSVIMLDIDRFKEINDNHGHGIGDNMLKYLATCLAERIRSTDILARYGGEEFTVLLS
ncbi:MAG: diguanylate cyclase, partial [Burkholderiales bacterium]|nr:diguanylate cyclase [Burkholderiales bacterium]